MTIREVLSENNPDLVKEVMGTLGSGLLVLAELKGKRVPLVGSLLLFAKEFSDLTKSVSTRQQLEGFKSLDPDTKMEVCPAPNGLAAALGFKKLTVLKPKISPPKVDLALLAELNGLHSGSIIQRPFSTPQRSAPASGEQQSHAPSNAKKPSAPDQRWQAPLPDKTPPGGEAQALQTIKGTIVDADSDDNLAFAYVALLRFSSGKDAAPATFTLGDGSFEFADIPAGNISSQLRNRDTCKAVRR